MNEPSIEAIACRVRAVVSNEPERSLDILAATLHTSPEAFRALVGAQEDEGLINVALLIDVVASLVRELAIDPQWLLTGRYDPSVHRRALAIAEDRSEHGERAIQQFVRDQYRKLATSG